MDGPCDPQPSRHPDLYPRWSSRGEGFCCHFATKHGHDLRDHKPVLTGPCNPLFAGLQKDGGAVHSQRAAVEHMGVDHRRSHLAVAAGRFGDAGGQHGSAHRLLDQAGIQVVTALLPAFGTVLARACGSCTLPQPAARSR